MKVGDVIMIPGDDRFWLVEFWSTSRARIVPLASTTRVIHTAQGDKTINANQDGDGHNISPFSIVDVVPVEQLPTDVRQRLDRKRSKAVAA